MKIERQGGTLKITGLRELGTANAHSFREVVRAALPPELQTIEIDLSQTNFVDSCGLGALISLYKEANQNSGSGNVNFRLFNPQPPVQQIFELTRMHHLFEIVQRSSTAFSDTSTPNPSARTVTAT